MGIAHVLFKRHVHGRWSHGLMQLVERASPLGQLFHVVRRSQAYPNSAHDAPARAAVCRHFPPHPPASSRDAPGAPRRRAAHAECSAASPLPGAYAARAGAVCDSDGPACRMAVFKNCRHIASSSCCHGRASRTGHGPHPTLTWVLSAPSLYIGHLRLGPQLLNFAGGRGPRPILRCARRHLRLD